MEVSLNAVLEAYSRLFQQIVDNRSGVEHPCRVEVHLNELAET